jgi:glycosyltransferase involved in cell wall biosynthesis
LDAENPRLLFIGRVAPNKCQHHLIQLAAGLKRAGFPGVTLKLVGSIKGCPRYAFVVERLAAQAGNVHLMGHVDDPLAMYADVDMFISASEHEGFGMPLVEAMFAGVPVVAYDAGAVAETVGGGGLVHRGKDMAEWVELVGGLLTDPTWLDALRRAGAKRAEAFTDERLAADLKRALLAAGLAL